MAGTVTLTATRQLSGDYGVKAPGDEFETSEEIAESLEARGLAVRGSVKMTDKVFQKAAEKRAETEEAEKLAVEQKAQSAAPENKAVEPASNKKK